MAARLSRNRPLARARVPWLAGFRSASSLSGFQHEMRCVAGRMDARRGAQPMAPPLASVATQQTPSRHATRRAGRPFGHTKAKLNREIQDSGQESIEVMSQKDFRRTHEESPTGC